MSSGGFLAPPSHTAKDYDRLYAEYIRLFEKFLEDGCVSGGDDHVVGGRKCGEVVSDGHGVTCWSGGGFGFGCGEVFGGGVLSDTRVLGGGTGCVRAGSSRAGNDVRVGASCEVGADVKGDAVVGGVDKGLAGVSARTLANRERRKLAKERKLRKQEAQRKVDEVPEWRKKFASGDLADSWAARKVRENKLAILKADEQIKRLESGAGKPRLQSKVLTEAEQEAKIRADYEKHMRKTEADIAYWKRRTEAGAVEKAIKLEMEIMDGQISGKYDPFASRRTIGWAKTIKTNSTGGSSANKTVWSGSGASGRSSKESVVSLEKYERDQKLKDKEIAFYKEQVLKEKKKVKEAEQHWLDQNDADYDY